MSAVPKTDVIEFASINNCRLTFIEDKHRMLAVSVTIRSGGTAKNELLRNTVAVLGGNKPAVTKILRVNT